MPATRGGQSTLVHSLATLLRNNGDSVLDGSSTLTLQVDCVQHLTRLFEQYLLSHTHQHGFLALPSHPADTTSLLQVQFLFDVLQKTISLKLISPPGTRLQSVVKIFPFKSLKNLELKRIPPHCLEGLRGVYSQLEVFTCSKSLNSLEELLSLCGGDLSSALPWLELHTLNFNYNSISCLDESLSLLNVLKSLDLSHNKIQDCAEFLKPLSELEHLNLAYNNLQRVPVLGLNARAKLITLVLRNNELETINGVEQLSSLQHLDLAYNLLMEHSQLAPLSLLHNLNTLTLEGNPLYFRATHRTTTVCHLSPRAAFRGLQLDGSVLSSSELAVLPKPGQLMGQTSLMQQVTTTPDQTVQEVSSGGGELSDSLSVGDSGVTRVMRKKSRNKVKVRRASISEPSDTDHESRPTALRDIVLHHQKDIERMDSFREQMGEDWLRYQHHLDGSPTPVTGPRVERVTAQVIANNCCTTSPTALRGSSPSLRLESLPAPLLSSELKGEEEEMESTDLQPETESTLQWTGHSPLNTESTLETSIGDPQAPDKALADPSPPEEEEEDLGVDLCRPMLVGVLSGDEEPARRKASEPFFLRVRQGHILEVDMHQGRVRNRLELDSLRQVTASQATWMEKEEERSHPALELHFSYISRERQKRRYIMLDDDPQQALQALAEVLSRVVEENKRQVEEGKPQGMRLQCLKCRAEFSQPAVESLASTLSQGHQDEIGSERERSPGDGVFCPECNSDHVVQLANQAVPSTSTPVHCGFGENGNRCFNFDDTDTPVLPHLPPNASTLHDVATDTFFTAQSGLSNITTSQNEVWVSQSFSSAENQAQRDPEGQESELAGSGNVPQSTQASSHAPFDLLSEDFEAVDHRLKLFLDVEVFEGEEEIHCFLKMSAVKFGDPTEFPSLMVVTDQRIYILEMTCQSDGQPSDWLQKRYSHQLCELRYLDVGLGSQTIHMEFDEGSAAYTLLVRDSARCKRFFSRLTGIARELAPKSDSKLKGISTTRLNPKHHLWPLVCEGSEPFSEEDSHPPFFYLLAFLQLGDGLTSVTVLATREMLCLLDEDHQWSKSNSEPTGSKEGHMCSGRVTVREMQPISCVSSIRLFSSDPCLMEIKLYDEMAKEERTWPLRAVAGQEIQGLVDWVRSQWEAMFGVKLITAIQ
ncbi:serine/threonine-protein kinase 11-interacting protein isoform X3 [Colossoma macropomum]|uniref:serine/threonine-protein kinase 11-interacting protein isoform X3 n=1 Tax=Colossoma macropomum TaxID=42526 RepID=UPI0018647165|nr:serine/threonine-protein kinase 11-interacting protein isoform X3 [Colossoma macropomum]